MSSSTDDLRLQPVDGACEIIFNRSHDHKEMVKQLRNNLGSNGHDMFMHPEDMKVGC